MPGLSFICDLDRGIDALLPAVDRGLQAARYDASYNSAVLCREPSYLLAASAYVEYPLSTFDFDDVTVHLEGRLYGPAATQRLLGDLARGLFERDEPVQQWVRDVDGEFVVCAVQRPTGRIVILNDRLGRLPLYCRRTSRTLWLSRDLRFLTRLHPRLACDRIGMAQLLTFGFPLGERTLLDGVERVAPGTCMRIDARKRTIRTLQAPRINLDPEPEAAIATGEAAHELAALFASACRARAATCGEIVVSLSGGADTRSIAACLHRLDIRYQSTTFLDADREAEADVAVAERLAALFASPWHLIRLPSPSARDELSLLHRKQGLNPLSMSYLIPYLDAVAQRFGRGIAFFTGDGGDKVLPDLRPSRDIADANGAADVLLRRHQIMPLEDVAALTGVAQTDVLMDFRARLDAYPEEGWVDRCVHFEICERGFKWLFEGEDRNRSFFWSVAPFYAAPFFFAAMRYGGRYKAHRGLYRDFLLEISPAAAGVEYAGIGAPMDSAAFRTAVKAASLLAEQLGRRSTGVPLRRVTGAAVMAAATEQIRRQIARCDAITDHLDADRLAAFLDGPAASLPRATDALRTLTSLMEDVTRGDDATPHLDPTLRVHADGCGSDEALSESPATTPAARQITRVE